ncbi:hypothetical protein JB92DRAFT_2729270 [Gautieria morchelliformis]|nr:hypothetical protein JB92DRAFT_2729270 [Gautieria morchelliformis]
MGNLCSKSSTHTGGHTLVDPAGPRQPTYGSGRVAPDVDARRAAAQAAENRLKAEQHRGVNRANPNQGRLAAKLEASKSGASEQDEMPDRVVVSITGVSV